MEKIILEKLYKIFGDAQDTAMVEEIKGILSKRETEIYALDESHFSTEPYLVRGWFKKRWPPQERNKLQERKSHILWMLKSGDTEVLLEEVKTI